MRAVLVRSPRSASETRPRNGSPVFCWGFKHLADLWMIYAGVLRVALYIAVYLAGVLSSWPQNPRAAQRLLIVVLKTPANNMDILEDISIVK